MTVNHPSRASASNARSLLGVLPDVALVLDEMGRIDFASAGSARYLGSRPSDWIGLSALDQIHQDDVKEVVARLKLSRSGKATPTQALPLRISGGDDGWRDVEAHGFVQIDLDGLAGTLVMFREVNGSLTLAARHESALAKVFSKHKSEPDAHRDDWNWATSELIPAVLDNPDPNGPMLAVVVMTLTSPLESTTGRDPSTLADPVAALANRLRKILRPRDVLARLGDSQLVILCAGLANCTNGLAVARRLHTLCSASAVGNVCAPSVYLSTGCAFASQGDNASDVLNFAASPGGQIESGQFAFSHSLTDAVRT